MSNDMIILDLTNYKERVSAHVTPGTYRVQVEDAELTQAKSGNTMVNTWLRIVGGEFNGQTIVDRLVLSEKAMFRVVAFMQAIGLPTPKKRLQLKLASFKGKTLEVQVGDSEYNGTVSSQVQSYSRVTQASAVPDPEAVPDLGTLEEPSEPAEAPVTPATPIEDDGQLDLDEVNL